MKVAIRADASPEIGSGHVMRCLCLADALRARGAQVRFVCGTLPEHLACAIDSAGHALTRLPWVTPGGHPAAQQAWPSSAQMEDARATRAALEGFHPDWLVVDHYGLDRCWENALRPAAARLMAIDDLARLHDCELVLDANFQPDPKTRYAASAGPGTVFLLGPAFALLRPEFAAARPHAAVRRGPARRLLIFMGGMDAGNATGRVLDALTLLESPQLSLDVVIGALHPARAAIEAFCHARPDSRCHVQIDNMAMLLSRCDLAVGAGGSATWERCCLGVPTLAMALAENQATLLAGAAGAGLVYAPDGGLPGAALLATHLTALLHNGALRESMSSTGMSLVDGRGAQRVAAELFGAQVTVRLAVDQDCDQILAWRNTAGVRAASRDNAVISPREHRHWFDQVLRSPDRPLLVGEDAQGAVGVVRFDIQGSEAEVSIYLASSRHGQGLGPGLLRAAQAWLADQRPDVSAIHADTLAGNVASRRLFEQAGYQLAVNRFSRKTDA